MSILVVVVIGTDDAFPEGCFVQSEDIIAVTVLLKLALHVDETDIAAYVVQAYLV